MRTKILNRDFQHPADGWYQIEALGEHPNRAAGVVQVIDVEAAQSIVNRFNADAAAGTLRHGGEMLIDHEHFSDNPEKESRAYGWLQELQNRADGIYGRIRWTTTGKAAVDGGDYRFFSTEYAPADLKVVNSKQPKKVRPLALDGLSLTNMNNNRGQKPITNRDEKNLTSAGAPVDSKPSTPGQKMKSVCTLLGLSADAAEEAVHAEVTKLKNRITTLEPMATENTRLKNHNTELETEQVAGLLDLHGVKEEKVRNRLTPVLAGMKNREERVAALVDFGFKPTEAKPAKPGRVINRGDGKPDEQATEAIGDEQAVANKIRNRATELQRGTPGRSWDSCWSEASRELTHANAS